MLDRLNLGLKARVLVLLLNALIFYVAFCAATTHFLPTGGLESAWLLSGFTLWFLTLSAPWFLPPRDGLVNALGAGLVLIVFDLQSVAGLRLELEAVRWSAIIYCVLVAISSLIALALHERAAPMPVGRFFYRLNAIFGRGELLFTFPALISIVGAFQGNLATTVWLLLLWTFFVIARPVERVAYAIVQWREERQISATLDSVGVIERVDHPNIVRVRLTNDGKWQPGTLHVAAMPHGNQQYVLALFVQVQGSEVIGTGLCVATPQEPLQLEVGHVFNSHDVEKAAEFIEAMSGAVGSRLIGFTVERSSIGLLRFEVAIDSELNEGDVVFAHIAGQDVFYQIMDAETAEESFGQNPRGTHIVLAAQLGIYEPAKGFTKFQWLPAMNTPLFSAGNRQFPAPAVSDRDFFIGKVPSTTIEVAANIDDLIEYHTAILGVTGTGKTELALDIVREAAGKGAKVFCVDFTGEYKHRLLDLKPVFPGPSDAEAKDLETKLFAVETGSYGAGEEKKALKAGVEKLRSTAVEQVREYLEGDNSNLAIFELSEITNTKATLRLTELYLSTIMGWARTNRQARQILIVLEEAHTIVPETAGSGLDFESQSVVSRIGQIALQGRKYGVGLLVVTQRTALVSKTILSQCNTFLTHCLVDQTSLTFLENVYSSQHARLIPNLANLQFLAYGKALRAERPILVQREFDPLKKKASDGLRRPLKADVTTPQVPIVEGSNEGEVAIEDEIVLTDEDTSGPRVRSIFD